MAAAAGAAGAAGGVATAVRMLRGTKAAAPLESFGLSVAAGVVVAAGAGCCGAAGAAAAAPDVIHFGVNAAAFLLKDIVSQPGVFDWIE